MTEAVDTALTVRVLVVDDQAPFRDAARAVVTRVPGFTVVGEATSGEEAVELCERERPDLVLMDIHMGGIDGIEATRRITGLEQRGPVVVLVSTHDVRDLPAAARRCGAVGYVHKDELSARRLRDEWQRASTAGGGWQPDVGG